MLIIPVYRGLDWRHPPVITIGLVLLNCLFFFMFQANEPQRYFSASQYYFQSGLHKQEFPHYSRYLQKKGENRKAEIYSHTNYSNRMTRLNLVLALQRDVGFLQQLQNNEIIARDSEGYAEWQYNRTRFNRKFERITTESYGYKPASPSVTAAFGHMFLHGGIGHLFGNMVVLFIAGLAVEAILGKSVFAISYVVTGLCAVGLFAVANPDSSVPLVGASGAIAGLVGMYTVLFGLRRIRFFYFILFYFDFIKAPALIILPIWLANELYQLYFGGVSNVAYMAHIGGAVSGAIVGFLLSRFYSGLNTAYMDEDDKTEKRNQSYEEGMQALSELKLEKAKTIFTELLQESPGDLNILQQLYNVEKFHPDSEAYHKTALAILGRANPGKDNMAIIHRVFLDYLKTARPAVKLGATAYLAIAEKFIKADYLEDAERIIGFLFKSGKPVVGLEKTMLALANMFSRNKQAEKARMVAGMLQQRFPDSAESRHAQQMLKMIS